MVVGGGEHIYLLHHLDQKPPQVTTTLDDDDDIDDNGYDKAPPVMNISYRQVSMLVTLNTKPHTLWDSDWCHCHFKGKETKLSNIEAFCPKLHS